MNVAILGLGVVGSGVYQILVENLSKIQHETGEQVHIIYGFARGNTAELETRFPQLKIVQSIDRILEDPQVDCLIEVMGGIEFPYEIIKKAFKKKKHVVTANKDLVAVHGVELLELAKRNGCDFYYEAAVAGGIPIVRSIAKGLASDHIYEICGILNGTTNFILTKMDQENVSYDAALSEAQALGFAEKDPTSDVEGIDAARKIAILSMMAYSMDVRLEDVTCTGITGISKEIVALARHLGYTIKLLGESQLGFQGISLSVSPVFIKRTHPLANVHKEMNAVYVKGNSIGETMFYGAGAGSLPTATAILSDVLEVVRNVRTKASSRDIVLPVHQKNIVTASRKRNYLLVGTKDVLASLVEVEHTLQNLVPQSFTDLYYIQVDGTLEEITSYIEKYEIQAYPCMEG